MKQLSTFVMRPFVLAFLLSLVLLTGAALPAAASSIRGVQSQASGIALSPGQTFCLPVQQVAGINGGQVAAGGFSFKGYSGTPFAALWSVYNGASSSSLHLIGQQDTSYFHEIDTVPIGSYYKSCITNNTSVLVTAQIEQSETYLN